MTESEVFYLFSRYVSIAVLSGGSVFPLVFVSHYFFSLLKLVFK